MGGSAVYTALLPYAGHIVRTRIDLAVEIPLPDATFHAVLCQHGLQQFPDRPTALRLANVAHPLSQWPGAPLPAIIYGPKLALGAS